VARTQPKPAARDPRPAASGARSVAAPARERATAAGRTEPRTSVSAVVLGVSTGGPTALSELIPLIPGNLRVPILAVQHMPPTFTKQLAARLNERCALTVIEAEPGMIPKPGHMYIAPGGMHMVVATTAGGVSIALDDGPPENSCKPAVDTLFRSAVKAWGGRLLGVILTGMGQDGLAGCRTLREAGGTVIVQDESSSVVWGMPGAVARAGLAAEELPLSEISGAIVQRCGFGGAGR
jgi:two-component system, chemotaxis family, protein-glutamate methylesterase/glutaminase